MDPLVSIVVPIYKVQNYIKKCVDTIINQTYENLEIILVDDGSPDTSGQIADRYAEMDSRVKVIHKENGGLSDARNAGLEVSKGDYICFIDSDDYIELNLIEKTLEIALAHDSDVVVFSLYNEVVDKNEEILLKDSVNINSNDSNSLISVIGYAWNKLYRTSYLKLHNFKFQKGLSLVEDIVFNEKVLTNTKKINYLNIPLYHYLNRSRPTLVKQYYTNSFELHKLGFNARKNVIYNLLGSNIKTQQLMAMSYINGIRFCCSNMFFYINNLQVKEKYNNIKEMLNDELTLEHIQYFKPKNNLDKLVKIAIVLNSPAILFFMYKLRSFKKKAGDFN